MRLVTLELMQAGEPVLLSIGKCRHDSAAAGLLVETEPGTTSTDQILSHLERVYSTALIILRNQQPTSV